MKCWKEDLTCLFLINNVQKRGQVRRIREYSAPVKACMGGIGSHGGPPCGFRVFHQQCNIAVLPPRIIFKVFSPWMPIPIVIEGIGQKQHFKFIVSYRPTLEQRGRPAVF